MNAMAIARVVKPSVPGLVACVFILAMTGCKTTGSTPEETKYGLFFSPADHVEELLGQDDFRSASEIYESEHDYFAEDSEKRKRVARQLADRLVQEFTPRLEQARQALDAVTWPTEVDNWPAVKSALKSGEQTIVDLHEHRILTEQAHRPASVTELEAGIETLRGEIASSADTMFQRYDMRRGESFFDAYPVDLHGRSFFAGKSWGNRLAGLSIVDLKRVLDHYGPYISDTMKLRLGTRFYEEKLALSTNEKASDLRRMMTAVSATKESGFELNRIPDAKIALVEVTSKTLLKKGEIEFPISIEVDLPFEATKAELDKVFDNPVAKNSDIVILLDVVLAKNDRVIDRLEKVASEYQSGTRSEPNPAYAQEQNALDAAKMELQGARIEMAVADSQFCYGWGCLAAAITQGIHAAIVADKEEAYKAAVVALNATPMTVEKPVYSPYTFNKAYIDAAKVATVNYYVVDRLIKTYFRDTFDARQSESFVVAYEVHPKERYRHSQLSNTNKEQEVSDFEEAELAIKLSKILDQFLAKSANLKPLPELVAIRKQILSDKNRVLAAVKEREYVAVPAQQDARFERTVVVYNPGGGLGSGFFVADDTVLTNYHVIEGTKFVEIKMFDGQETFGKIVAHDIRLDLALIKVQARGVPVQFLGKREISLGETVEAIGHPNGLEFTITRGVISAMRKRESLYTPGAKKVRFIQTDTAINPGNSGGPLFLNEKVIGVNNNKIVKDDIEGIGFSVHYSEVIDFLRKHGFKPYLGT
jgi:serine protease Do